MTLQSSLLPVLDSARTLLDGFGLRQTRVIVRSRSWSSGEIQVGTPAVSDLELDPRPKVKGLVGDPVLLVGPITPEFVAGGYAPAQLNPSDSAGFEYYWVCVGRDGVERPYKVLKMDTTKSFRYMFELQSLGRVMPF